MPARGVPPPMPPVPSDAMLARGKDGWSLQAFLTGVLAAIPR